ncbi:MAG: hypothetical protein WBP42_05790 [Candidatus Zixiibacteriota bacterium]
MKLLDLTAAYCQYVVEDASWPKCERLCPALFRHYFHFWAKRAYPNIDIPIEALQERSEMIKRRLPRILHKFKSHGFDTGRFSFVLFVGKGCTNGHAMLDGNKWIVWIPVETYPTARLVDVFVTHEIAHALHYANSPRFYFATKSEQRHFSRQLLTEGIATRLTAHVLGCSDNSALWGSFLRPGQLAAWRASCKKRWQALLGYAIRNFNSEAKTELFQGNDPTDVFKFRAGYLLGLNLADGILGDKQLTPLGLISLPRRRLEQYARAQLNRWTESCLSKQIRLYPTAPPRAQ